MTKTENYNLPQWEKTDRVLMEDFNDMTVQLENGLTNIAQRIPKIVTGSYIGTGGAKEISLGFQPFAVLLMTSEGMVYSGGDTYGGLMTLDMPLKCNAQTEIAAEITETGFKVYGVLSNSCSTNLKNVVFYYIAIRW